MSEKILIGVVLWVVSAFAVKQSAYILIRGSIFNSLREWISWRAQVGYYFYGKLRDLFACNLCMTTQVSLWAVAPAGTALAYQHLSLEMWQVPFAFLAIVFGVSGLAIAVWNVTEFLPREFEHQANQYEEKIALLQDRLQKGGGFKLITKDQFEQLLDQIRFSCRGIGCPIEYAKCYKKGVTNHLALMAQEGRLGENPDLPIIEMALLRVVPGYLREIGYFTDAKERAYKRLLSSE